MILGFLIFAKLTLYGLAVFRLSQEFRCNSIFISFPIAAYATLRYRLMDWVVIAADMFILALALSALAIIFSRAFPPR